MSADALAHLDGLELTRAGIQQEAGILLCSLPLPRGAGTAWCLEQRPTYGCAVGQWPDVSAASPRRLLLAADAVTGAPERVSLAVSHAADTQAASGQPCVDTADAGGPSAGGVR